MNGIFNSSPLEGYQDTVIMFVIHKDLEDRKLCLLLARFWWKKDEKTKKAEGRTISKAKRKSGATWNQ